MRHRLPALLAVLLGLLVPAQVFAGFWGDVYDYWSSGEMGEDMLNTVALRGEDVVYAIDHPDEVVDAIVEDVSSGDAGERILGAVGLNPEDVAYVVDNPGEVADAIYQGVSSGEAGERLLNAVGLTGEDLVYIIDNPDVLRGALYDEWSSGRAGERLIEFGAGLYEGGREMVTETFYMVADGGAQLYIVTAYEDYDQVLDAYDPRSMLVQAYTDSDDPGETTRQLLSGFAQLPTQFRDAMWNDPRQAGHFVGVFAVPVAAPRVYSGVVSGVPRIPGLRWTATEVSVPSICNLSRGSIVSDLRAVTGELAAGTERVAATTVAGETAAATEVATTLSRTTRLRGRRGKARGKASGEAGGEASSGRTRRGDASSKERPRPAPRDPDPATVKETGEVSGVSTQRAAEVPYHNPPNMVRVRPGEPLDLTRLARDKKYLWAVDEQGNVLVALEDQMKQGFALTRPKPGLVKHGDLTPGPDGLTRGPARAGGELNWDSKSSTWVLDNNSSYTFARLDGKWGTPENLQAVRRLLEQSGTDVSGLRLVDILAPSR